MVWEYICELLFINGGKFSFVVYMWGLCCGLFFVNDSKAEFGV